MATRLLAAIGRSRPTAWALPALFALSCAACSGARAVTVPHAASAAPFPATLQTTRGPLVLDLNDAQAITRSLRNFLHTDPSVKSIALLDSTSVAWLRAGDAPFVDPDGWVRIGLWLLQARGDAVVLVYRAPGATTGQASYQYVASVSVDARRQWQVTAINRESLLAR